MCDFSLEHLASRPAKVGDQLVTTKFGGMYTTGFCSVGEPSLAVCIKPGTELAFEREIEGEALFFMRRLGSRVARFRRVNEDRQCVHHDALELPVRKSCPAHTPSSGPTRYGLAVAGRGAREGSGAQSARNRSTLASVTWVPYRYRAAVF